MFRPNNLKYMLCMLLCLFNANELPARGPSYITSSLDKISDLTNLQDAPRCLCGLCKLYVYPEYSALYFGSFGLPATATLRKRGATPKRLQPSEPLHMTTRAASRATSVVSATATESAASDHSRCNSLGKIVQKTSGAHDESDRPAKILRRSRGRSFARSGRKSSSSQEAAGAPKGEIIDPPDNREHLTSTVLERKLKNGSNGRSQTEDEVDIPQASIETPVSEQGSREKDVFYDSRLVASPAPQSPFASHRSSSRGTPSRSQKHDSIERGSPWKHKPGGILEKLPGRRRAPHPNADIEANLRRQLELKVVYRAVVKALKPLLGELAERTAQDLEVHPDLYRQYPAFGEINAELDVRLSQRLAVLTMQLREEEARMKRMFNAGHQLTRNGFAQKVQDLRGDCLLRCQDHFLSTVRGKQKQDDSDATDDEDRTISRPHIRPFPENANRAFVAYHDSRSHFFVKTQRLWEDFELRHDVCKELRAHDDTVVVAKPENFAVYNGEQRRAAIAVLNLNLLANASRDSEDQAARTSVRKNRIIPNCEASGLQVLATAVEMASPATSVVYQAFQLPQKSAYLLDIAHQPVQETRIMTNKSFTFATPSPKKRTPARKRQTPVRAAAKGPISAGGLNGQPVEHGIAFAFSHGPHSLPAFEVKPPALIDSDNVPSSPALSSCTLPSSLVIGTGTVTSLPIIHTGTVPTSPLTRSSARTPDAHPSYIPMQVDLGIMPDEASAGLRVSGILTETTLPPRIPTATDKPPRQRKRPGPRAHYATPFSVCPTVLAPQQNWSPFTNTMGPPMFLPKYIKDLDVKRKDIVPSSPISQVTAPVTGLLPEHTYKQQRQDSGASRRVTPRSAHQLIAPASMPAKENVMIAPVQPHGNVEHTHHPSQPTSHGFICDQNRSEAHRPLLFLQPMQPPPFFNPPPPHQNPLYQPNNIYGPFKSYNIPQSQSQASPSPHHPVQSQPPPLLPSPRFLAHQQQQFYYAAGPATHLSVPPFTSVPPQGSPPQSYSRGMQPRHNSMPVSMMLQQTGQSGHQPILPATMDPRRRQDEPVVHGLGTTNTDTRGVPGPGRAPEFDHRQYARIPNATPHSATLGEQRQLQQQGSERRRHSSPQNFRPQYYGVRQGSGTM